MTSKTEYFVFGKGVSWTKTNQHLLVPKQYVEANNQETNGEASEEGEGEFKKVRGFFLFKNTD